MRQTITSTKSLEFIKSENRKTSNINIQPGRLVSTPFAGANGTESFTSYGLFNGSGTNRADTVVTATGIVNGYYSTGTMSDKLHNNILIIFLILT